MARWVEGGAGISVDMDVVYMRMKAMGADMKQLTAVYREAFKPLQRKYKMIAPHKSGFFKRQIYRRATNKFGALGLHTSHSDHAGVVEFGGTIPVSYSRKNPRLRGQRRMANKYKPWIGGKSGTSYYLYPMWDANWQEVLPEFNEHMLEIAEQYMPS